MKKISFILFTLLVLSLFSCNSISKNKTSTSADEKIRLNQIGFFPNAGKLAVLTEKYTGEFFLKKADSDETVYTGKVEETKEVDLTCKQVSYLDFSDFQQEGEFYIEIPEVSKSGTFTISKNVFEELGKASLKGFYFQRMSTELPEEFAGKWKREFAHPDTNVLVHPSAASKERPAGTVLSIPYGWYDAGDYGKYVVNSGITTGTLLSLYQDFPDFFAEKKLNIPESNNNLPDILDETLWNLRWMIKMQDPNDGGVYHKLTTANFEGFVMPKDATKQRYVVQKGTSAALNFAAVMAQTARIFKKFEKELPGFADSCLLAAEKAWNWAKQNPEIIYNQGRNNEKFEPKVNTGEYGDSNFEDEFFWASAELFITTKNEKYKADLEKGLELNVSVPSWGDVKTPAFFSLLRNKSAISEEQYKLISDKLLAFAEKLIKGTEETIFKMVMGKEKSDFIWGSSSLAANQGIVLLKAYKLSGDKKFYNSALANLDYLLGRNATAFSFVTGFGSKPVMNIHHRQSGADGIDEPVPGLLSGGPNKDKQDDCKYPTDVPEECFVDEQASYASNEIAINWQAPLAYLVNAIEALNNAEE